MDPIFAIFVGLSAAAVRVRREEKEKGFDTTQTLGRLRNRMGLAFGS